MPTREHEFPLTLIEDDPPLAARLLRWAGGPEIPKGVGFRLESADLSECDPAEYRADRVVGVYVDPSGRPQCGVIVESQRQYDKNKYWSWPAYVANFRARKKCEGYLVVICFDDKVAEQCRMRIPLGNPDSYLYVLVVGPKEIPLLTDPDNVKDPLDTVISALFHVSGPRGPEAFDAMMVSLHRDVEDEQTRRSYIDNVVALQPDDVRAFLEELVKTKHDEPKTELFKGWKAEGKAEGRRQSLIELLEARGVTLDDSRRELVASCDDPEQLGVWFRRAMTASSADEVFAE
ncbi:hypothetical protein [Actinomadura rupiterrae]|uniref:hypothetical protein n=1 Tax=Actinomadura rupiterrae TaxID=559627 RepID=UPI0020A49405|nr:hypothetical protein [Actinomadura rupiterrae]MCP2335465.1 hypothetical protein [Actinomadura rupiterrae]